MVTVSDRDAAMFEELLRLNGYDTCDSIADASVDDTKELARLVSQKFHA